MAAPSSVLQFPSFGPRHPVPLTGVFLLTRENAGILCIERFPLRPFLASISVPVYWQCPRSITIFSDRDYPFKLDIAMCRPPSPEPALSRPRVDNGVSLRPSSPSHHTYRAVTLRSNRSQFAYAAQHFPRGTSRPLVSRPFINLSVGYLLLYVQPPFLHIYAVLP